jgi:hypothetical protein
MVSVLSSSEVDLGFNTASVVLEESTLTITPPMQ